jgi:methylenetetrahydrofolate reductase (NADPH)
MSKKNEMTCLHRRLDAGKAALLAEVPPPKSGDAAAMRAIAKVFGPKVHALGVTDNQQEVRMSALAAASLAVGEGIEVILHVVTRDRNRIALASDCLGAGALGIRNVLCTTGTHQTLGRFRAARNVYDIDSVQLIQMYSNLSKNGSLVGEDGIEALKPFYVGGVAAPFADPLELQVSRLAKKVKAGAKFLITQPIFDLDRFAAWWNVVTQKGLHEKVAIIAGVRAMTSAAAAEAYAQRRPSPAMPETLLKRISAKPGAQAQAKQGVAIACETIDKLRALAGLRGFDISAEGDCLAALAVIEAAGLKVD